jgi:hypothetical protein
MRIVIAIQNTSGQPAKIFNARSNYTASNFGNTPMSVSVSIATLPDYTAKYGTTQEYRQFLADCFKYNFVITAINGKATNINPFKDEYLTMETTLNIDLNQ